LPRFRLVRTNLAHFFAEIVSGIFANSYGGIFGSLMVTPIPNLPKFSILGMHNIYERLIAKNGELAYPLNDASRPQL